MAGRLRSYTTWFGQGYFGIFMKRLNVKRFKDRMHAGELLVGELKAYARRPDAIVLALPRGGVPVGIAVAEALDVPLDVLVVRKLGTLETVAELARHRVLQYLARTPQPAAGA
jgi:adenine/guanine phosphoribosyltransferase-like PRPP-binding protein